MALMSSITDGAISIVNKSRDRQISVEKQKLTYLKIGVVDLVILTYPK